MKEKGFDFLFPSRIMWEKETYRTNYGQLIVEPLEKGFGATVGNSLRRVLLSSIPGIAITGIKISGVHHEFSTIPGVKEDVTQIILNLKQVICKPVISEFPHRCSVIISGISEICAKHLITDGSIEILNGDLHIATVDPSQKLTIDFEITSGRGYIPVEKIKLVRKDIPMDMILIDGIYTPVKKVAFRVENTRVGSLVDYEKLLIDIWTNGAITPYNAVEMATDILNSHFTKIKLEQAVDEKQKSGTGTAEDILITDLNLPTRVVNALKLHKIHTLKDLLEIPKDKFSEVKNLGEKSLQQIEKILEKMGYKLKENLSDAEQS